MDEREILTDLENLSTILGELPELKDDQRINNMFDMYVDANKNLMEYKIYNEINTEETITLKENISNLELEKEPFDKQFFTLEADVKRNKDTYNNTERLIAELKEDLKRPGLSERKKQDHLLSIHMCEQTLANLDSESKKLNEKLSDVRSKRDKLNNSINEKKKALKELYKQESDRIELDAQTLYFAYDFFSSNPQEEIQNTINDFKDGVIDLNTLNERLQNLKVLLSSGLYNLDEFNKKVREKRIQDIAKAVELQVAKVREANNIDYYEKQIKFHKEMINRKDGDIASHQACIDEFESRIKYLFVNGTGAKELLDLYDLQSAYVVGDKVNENTFSDALDNLINKTGKEELVEKVGRQVPNYFPEEYLYLLDKATMNNVNERIDEEVKSAELNEEEVKPLINNQLKQLEEEKDKEQGLIPVGEPEVDEAKIDGPKVEVKKIKNLEPSKLDKIKDWFNANWKKITVVGSVIALSVALAWSSCSGVKKKTNNSDQVAVVVTQAPEKTKKPVIPKPTEEPVVTPEPKKEPVVTPEPTEEPVITPEPTEEPVVTPEPTEEPVVTPEPTEEPVVTPEPTEEPVVTPEPTEEPTNDYKLRTEETVQEEQGPVGDSAPADAEMSPQLHGNALMLEDPTTNTTVYVDSEGNKITKEEDGSFVVEEHVQEVVPADDGTVIVHNPDMSPAQITEEQPPEESISLDDYNAQKNEEMNQIEEQRDQGLISAEEAAEEIARTQEEINMANEAFDEWFSDLSEGKEIGR